MSDSLNTSVPEPPKVGAWSETTQIKPKELIIPKKSPEPSDDIPTLPDLDDLQDILEKEISSPPVTEKKDKETVSVLAEVSGGVGTSRDGIDKVLEVLYSYIPEAEPEVPDEPWTVDSLLAQLVEEAKNKSK